MSEDADFKKREEEIEKCRKEIEALQANRTWAALRPFPVLWYDKDAAVVVWRLAIHPRLFFTGIVRGVRISGGFLILFPLFKLIPAQFRRL